MRRRGGKPSRIRRQDSVPSTSIFSSSDSTTSSTPASERADADSADNADNADNADPRLSTAPSLSLSPRSEPPALGPHRVPRKPFPFLSLPTELRLGVYAYHFADAPAVVDLDPDNYKRIHQRLALFRVCRLIREEASHWFFSSRTFRIFPTHPGRSFKTKRPLLARLCQHQRASISSLELRLGPGWSNPPRGWVVNEALGLRECVGVRRLVVFVECDPSDSVFKGFRQPDGFYERFSKNLLAQVLEQLPSVRIVEFDAWPSVKRSGAMMRALTGVVANLPVATRWGPERGWTDVEDDQKEDEKERGEYGETDKQVASLNLIDGIMPPPVSFAGHGAQSVWIST